MATNSWCRPDLLGSRSCMRGQKLGRYHLTERLGSGGMGDVYLAHDPLLGREVAIKVLRERNIGAEQRRQLSREAQAMARLSHPNILPVFDVGVATDELFIAMAYVRGGTLRQWLAQPRRCHEILEKFAAAGLGLAAAHEVGIVHRDFKPANVLLDDDGRVFVADFGLALLERPTAEQDTPNGHASRGRVVGTTMFMAPEQHDGEDVGPAADQYAFFVALYEALYGELPFRAGGYYMLIRQKREGSLVRPSSNREVGNRLWRVIERGLHPEPTRRWESMEQVTRLLQPPRRSRRFWMLGTPLMAGAGAATATPMAGPPCPPAPIAAQWTAEQQLAVRTAILGSGLPAPGRTANSVLGSIDTFVRTWQQRWQAHCLVDDRQHDRERYCLERQLDVFAAAVALLQSRRPEVMEEAIRVAQSVEQIDPCPSGGAYDPHLREEPERYAQLLALGRGNAELAAAVSAYLYDDIIERAPALIEQASAAGFPGLVAEAELFLSKALARTDAAAAFEHATRGFFPALEAGEHELAVLLAAHAATAALAPSIDDIQSGTTWARQVEALAAQDSHDPRVRGAVLAVRTSVALSRGERDAAVALKRRASELVALRFGEGSQQHLVHLSDLAWMLTMNRQLDEGAELFGRVIRSWREEDWFLVTTLQQEAINAQWRGDLDAAERGLLRALKIARSRPVPRHDEEAEILADLGDVVRGEEGLRLLEEAVELCRRGAPKGSVRLATKLVNAAGVAFALGDLDAAQAYSSEGTAMAERLYSPGSAHLGSFHNRQGAILLARGKPAEAKAYFEQALIGHRSSGTPGIIPVLVNLAWCERLLGEATSSREHLAEALRIAQDLDSPWQIIVVVHLVGLDAETGRSRSAIEHATEILSNHEQLDPLERGLMRLALAEALVADGDEKRARLTASSAWADLRDAEPLELRYRIWVVHMAGYLERHPSMRGRVPPEFLRLV